MRNIVINMCEKFHYDRLRNNKALADRKSDNNKKKKKNVRIAFGDPFPGLKILVISTLHVISLLYGCESGY